MKIKQFIEGRNISYDTVRKYIVNNAERFKGHVGKSNNIILDEVAIKILEEKYPLPSPVQIVKDTAAREKLQELQEKYATVLEENNRLTKDNANLLLLQHKQHLLEMEMEEKNQLLEESRINVVKILEEKTAIEENAAYQIDSRDKRILNLEARDSWITEKWGKEQDKVQELQEQLEREKSKTWWDKLRGR